MTIECREIVVLAASLRIDARNAEDGVILRAEGVRHDSPEFDLSGATRDGLQVIVSDTTAYPWSSFVSQGERREGDDSAIEEAVRQLRRLATRFKPGPVSGNDPALPVKIIDVLVARRRVSPEMYQYGLETGLVSVVGKVCFLRPQQFGMNIVDLRERRVTPAVEKYLAGYIDKDQST